MHRSNGKDGGGKDLQVLQNEYKHMQVNRNAFANESELVRMNDFNQQMMIFDSILIPYASFPFCRSYANSKRL